MTANKFTDSVIADIVSALSELKSGHFTKRIVKSEFESLNLIVDEINKLAQALEDQTIELRAKQIHSNTIVSSLPQLIAYLDRNLNYQYVNSAYAKWFEVSEAYCLKSNIVDIMGIESVSSIKCFFEDALEGNEQSFSQFSNCGKNENKHTSVKLLPDKDNYGQVKGVIIIIQDITEEKAREARHGLVLENISSGLVIQDSTAKIIEYNSAALTILGLTKDQLLGRTSMDPCWKAIREDGTEFSGETHPAVVALRTGKKIIDTTMGIQLPSGESRWLRINAIPFNRISSLGNEKKSERNVQVAFTDITSFMTTRTEFERIFSVSPDLICITDMDGKFKKINPSFNRVLGYSDEELSSMFFMNFIHPDDLQATLEQFKKLAENNKALHSENRFKTKSGEYRILNWVAQPDPRTSNLYVNARDVTEQRQKEFEYKFVINTLDLGIWKFDPRNNQLEWDDSMYRLFDVDPKMFSGAYDAWESALTLDAREKAVLELKQALDGEKEFNTIFQIKIRNGSIRHIAARGVVIRNENNEAIKMYGVNWDVTDRAQSEIQLRENEQLLSTVLETLPLAVFAKDIKNNFQWKIWNKKSEELFGIMAQDCIGKYDQDFFPKDQVDHFRATDLEACKSFGIIDIPEESAQLAKGLVLLHTKKIVIRDSNGEPRILLGLTEDITDKASQERQIKEIELKLIHASKLASLGEMSAGIAHEINNPLAIILGSLDHLIKFANNPQKLNTKIEAIKKSSARIAKIVNGLKKFSRSSTGSNYTNNILSEIISESLVLTEIKSKLHSTPITCDIKSKSIIYCDQVEIEQVLINLINNSIDAVKNKDEKWVKIELRDEEQLVILRVIDSGTGITETIRNKLFDPFFTTKTVGEGTGLGLSITKGILDQHMATISVLDNHPNTCFEIHFQKVQDANAS